MEFNPIFQQYDDAVLALELHRNKLPNQLSQVDKDISNIYHILEYLPLDAVMQSKMMKALIIAVRKRRQIKEELCASENMLDRSKSFRTQKEASEKRNEAYYMEALESLKKYM
jgi:hypothetical protein